MKIVALSDMHGHLPEIEPCDLLIIGGDIAPDYISEKYSSTKRYIYKGESKQGAWFANTFQDWLLEIPAKRVVGIGGNHDFALDTDPQLGPSLSWNYLDNECIKIDGLRIYGIPHVPYLPFWAFHATEAELVEKYDAMPPDVDIVVSHGPPYTYRDVCSGKWGTVESVGSKPFNDWLKRNTPKAVVCGHIHPGAGVSRHSNGITEIINVAIKDDFYDVVRGPIDISWVLNTPSQEQ